MIKMDDLTPTPNDTKRTLGWKMLLRTAIAMRSQPDKAERIYLQTLSLVKRRLGDRDRAVAYVLLEIGAFYSECGQYEKACSHYLEAKEILSPTLEIEADQAESEMSSPETA